MGSSAVSSHWSLLEPTLASNEGVTCGGWAPDEPTLGRPTWLVGRPGWSADRKTRPNSLKLHREAARWAPISFMWVRACLKAVW